VAAAYDPGQWHDFGTSFAAAAGALLGLAFYVLTGLGISVGFHRLLTHRSFTAARPLRIALAVAEINGCSYCLSAHTYLGKHVAKLDDAELAANRAGGSGDPKADAAVRFAVRITEHRGRVSEADLKAVKAAGYSDAQLVEIVRAVNAEGIAVIWIEHVVRALTAVVSRLLCLTGGKFVGDGTPAEVLATPAVREVFLGSDVTASLTGGTLDEDLIGEDTRE